MTGASRIAIQLAFAINASPNAVQMRRHDDGVIVRNEPHIDGANPQTRDLCEDIPPRKLRLGIATIRATGTAPAAGHDWGQLSMPPCIFKNGISISEESTHEI